MSASVSPTQLPPRGSHARNHDVGDVLFWEGLRQRGLNRLRLLVHGTRPRDQCTHYPTTYPLRLNSRLAVASVFGVRALNAFDTFPRPGPGAFATMKPASSIGHCWTLTSRTTSGLSSAPWRLAEVSWWVPVLEPPAPTQLRQSVDVSRINRDLRAAHFLFFRHCHIQTT